jgi:hypothetical protein
MSGQKWRTGEIDKVPCPYDDCGKPNDFRGNEEFLFNRWTGESMSRDEPTFNCDHCNRLVVVVRAVKTAVISVRCK